MAIRCHQPGSSTLQQIVFFLQSNQPRSLPASRWIHCSTQSARFPSDRIACGDLSDVNALCSTQLVSRPGQLSAQSGKPYEYDRSPGRQAFAEFPSAFVTSPDSLKFRKVFYIYARVSCYILLPTCTNYIKLQTSAFIIVHLCRSTLRLPPSHGPMDPPVHRFRSAGPSNLVIGSSLGPPCCPKSSKVDSIKMACIL